jgi:hypothetical protein
MFKVGQKVVCIDDSPRPNRPVRKGITIPKKDKIYTVRDMYTAKSSGELALILVEIKNPPHPDWGKELGFLADRFKPIDDSYNFAEGVLAKLEKGFKRKTKKKILSLEE